jgi:hypothetical protein
VRGWRVRGQIALTERRWDAAEHALGEAITIARFIRNPTQLWRTHMQFARLHAALGQNDRSYAHRNEARRVIEQLRDRASNPVIRAALEAVLARASDPELP